MEQVSRIWFTPRQRSELWERWRSVSISRTHLNKIALRLNQCPRKTLGFESPAD